MLNVQSLIQSFFLYAHFTNWIHSISSGKGARATSCLSSIRTMCSVKQIGVTACLSNKFIHHTLTVITSQYTETQRVNV